MVDAGQDNVLGSTYPSKEQGKLKEKCEILEQENFVDEQEPVDLRKRAELAESL